jgi:curli production assembly/transport component CsgF
MSKLTAIKMICTTAIFSHAVFFTDYASATEMVYTPLNPSFGGNPNNGVVLLNSASATNKHKDSASSLAGASLLQKTPLQTFNDNLERAILGQLASSASQKLLGGTGGGLTPGTVETGNFTIRISDLGGGALQVTTTDKVTGISTSFQVGQ